MKLVRWKRFTWDLSKLPLPEKELSGRVGIRSAVSEDARAIPDVVFSAFSSDSAWGDVLKLFRPVLLAQITAAFEQAPVPVIVVTHGHRVIGASLLTVENEAECHLLSGPCVLSEYRSRGLGTTLLHHSLLLLKSNGLQRAYGICKDTAPLSKFVYPKFGSTSEEYDFELGLAGAR